MQSSRSPSRLLCLIFRHRELSPVSATGSSLPAPSTPLTGLRSVEDEALRALPDTEIISALRALPAGYPMAVYYADVEGLSCKHISEIMHTPVGTVVSRLHRGRRRVRVLLNGVATDRGIVRGRCLQMTPAPSRADVVRSAICLEPRSANARCRGVPDPFRTR